jgi:predicted nucleic-acid-binding protein
VIALDTNVLVRVVTGDDPHQLPAAVEVMRHESLFLAKSVLLESEWVLRYTYRLRRETIAQVVDKLLGYRNLRLEHPIAVARALDWYRDGMDFADALHLASSGEAERFATFDRTLAETAARSGALPVVRLLHGGE